MVARIDTPKIQAPGAPAPKPAPPRCLPGEAPPAARRDGLTLSAGATSETPAIGTTTRIEGGKIYTSNTVKIDADPERVMAAIEGDWSKWWPVSKVDAVPAGTNLPRPEENETRFRFQPKGSKGNTYVVQQFMPVAEAIGPGTFMMVVPTTLSGDARGQGRYEIRVTPDNKTLLTAKWEGVAPANGRNPQRVADEHLATERRAFEKLGTWVKDNP